MPFQSLGRTLTSAFNYQAQLKGEFLMARVLYIAGEILTNLWSAEQSAYVRVVGFSEGKLIFSASVGAAAQALKAQAMSIQNAINRELGAKIVQQIEVRQSQN